VITQTFIHSLFKQYWLGWLWEVQSLIFLKEPINIYAVKPVLVDLMKRSTTN
jgi:hypothetical protein